MDDKSKGTETLMMMRMRMTEGWSSVSELLMSQPDFLHTTFYT